MADWVRIGDAADVPPGKVRCVRAALDGLTGTG